VLTTVFAATVGGRQRGGYGVANDTVAGVLRDLAAEGGGRARVSTGPCAPG
jgi:hypothetical protein